MHWKLSANERSCPTTKHELLGTSHKDRQENAPYRDSTGASTLLAGCFEDARGRRRQLCDFQQGRISSSASTMMQLLNFAEGAATRGVVTGCVLAGTLTSTPDFGACWHLQRQAARPRPAPEVAAKASAIHLTWKLI